jgi:hypothetical protein
MNFIPLPKAIIFLEPVRQHQNDPITDAELARKLEKRYGILKIFAMRRHTKDIRSIIIDTIRKSWKDGTSQERTFKKMAYNITDLWKSFIMRNETGIVTKASVREGRQSFLDTGEYYRRMGVRVE